MGKKSELLTRQQGLINYLLWLRQKHFYISFFLVPGSYRPHKSTYTHLGEERLGSVRIGKCRNAFFYQIGKCPNRKVSKSESVRIGKRQNWKVSELESVRIVKCQNCKVSEL